MRREISVLLAAFVVAGVLSLGLTGSAIPAEGVVNAASGEPFAGQFKHIAKNGVFVFQTPDGERSLATNELVLWGAGQDSAADVQVLLADGSLLVAKDVRLTGKRLLVATSLFGQPEGFELTGNSSIPLDAVRGVIFRVPLDPLARDRLIARIQSAKGSEDEILLANGDTLSGTFRKLDYVGDGETAPPRLTLTIETRDGAIDVHADRPQGTLQDKVVALVMNPALVRPVVSDSPVTLLALSDGSRLWVKKADADKDEARFTLACGVTLESNPDINIWREVALIQPLGMSAKYISELPALGYKHVPLLDLETPLGVDRNVLGGWLRADGKWYARGLGMPGNSRVAFALDKAYRRLEGQIAVDDAAGEKGIVKFIILGDAGGTFRPIYESPVLRGGEEPVALAVDLAGVKRLALVVDAADHGPVSDYANWLNLRLLE